MQHALFSLRARPNGTDAMRLAVSAPRALGRAVARNRARRRLREAFRLEIAPLRAAVGLDLLVVAREPIARAEHAKLRAAVRESLVTLGGRAW